MIPLKKPTVTPQSRRSFRLSRIVLPLCLLGTLLPAPAATYYVDYAGGNNAADGTSPQSAFKHSPGDSQATGNAARVELQPGDTVLFKGGVTYHGSIRLARSGETDKPITLDGNSAGTFGKGRAILDGGQIIDGWKRYASAEEAQGNPRWKEIFYTDIEAADLAENFTHGQAVGHRLVPRNRQAPWQRIILSDGDSHLLPIAKFPKPADRFYTDLPEDFLESPHKIEMRENASLLTDEKILVSPDPDHYQGTFIGVHVGNNIVNFAAISGYDPKAHQLRFAAINDSLYPTTRYSFYNSVRLITEPGEWSIAPVAENRFRISLLPERLEGGQPVNIGYPVLETGITIADGASHIGIQGFRIQRFADGAGGISVARSEKRSQNITLAGNEIRFVSGHAGIGVNHADHVVVENNSVYNCPSWTTGIFLDRVNDYVVRHNHLVKNSGSGIRHYESKRGRLHDNVILDHYGIHSSAINVYEGCEDLVLERNYIHNTIAINRNAKNILFRNNVVDCQGKGTLCVGMWVSGSTGGRDLIDIQFLNNTFVNTDHAAGWSAGILGQRAGHGGAQAGPPRGLVIRNNIIDRLADELPGIIEGNIYTRPVDERFMGETNQVVTDWKALFLDPAKGDFRRRPGGPLPEAGADIPPPPARPE